MNRPQHRPAHQGGFSLVELLVSMTLGLVMLGALAQMGGLPAHSQQAGLVLGFAAVPEAQIDVAVQALRQAWGL